MSVTTTAGLTAYFQHADTAGASNSTNALSGVAVASGTPAVSSATTVLTSAATTAAPSATAAKTAATAATTAATTGAAGTTGTTGTTAPSAAATTSAATSAAVASSTAATLADGTYTGATANNRYGPVQVQITVAGGKITAAVAVQTPTDRRSVSINDQATPMLASEVLSAQSANIDTVSGATYTTNSYKASLQSAIDLARSTAVAAGASA